MAWNDHLERVKGIDKLKQDIDYIKLYKPKYINIPANIPFFYISIEPLSCKASKRCMAKSQGKRRPLAFIRS